MPATRRWSPRARGTLSRPRRRARPGRSRSRRRRSAASATPIGRPFRRTPLVESRSTQRPAAVVGPDLAWRRETSCAGITMSASALRPITTPPAPIGDPLALDVQPGAGSTSPHDRRRSARTAVGGGGTPCGARPRGAAVQAGLDRALPEREPRVGAQLDLRARRQRELLGARVLEQVRRELVDQARPRSPRSARRSPGESQTTYSFGTTVLDSELLAVAVHLAHEPPRQLDRRDLAAERASERPLDEVGDLGLEAAEDAHRRVAWRPPRARASPCYGTPAPDRAAAGRPAPRRDEHGECPAGQRERRPRRAELDESATLATDQRAAQTAAAIARSGRSGPRTSHGSTTAASAHSARRSRPGRPTHSGMSAWCSAPLSDPCQSERGDPGRRRRAAGAVR